VPIFVPTWWPFAVYKRALRIAAAAAMVVFGALGIVIHMEMVKSGNRCSKSSRRTSLWVSFATLALVTASYIRNRQAQPVCYREAGNHSRAGRHRETESRFG